MKLSILLYAFETPENMVIVEDIKNKLQAQLNAISSDDIEVIFKTSQEESIDEMRSWLLEKAEARKYAFISTDSEIKDNFVLLRYNAIKYGLKADKLIELNIFTK